MRLTDSKELYDLCLNWMWKLLISRADSNTEGLCSMHSVSYIITQFRTCKTLWMTMQVLHGGDLIVAQPEHSDVCEVFAN